MGQATTVELPGPASTVRVTLVHFAQPVTVVAYNADGSQAGTQPSAPQSTLETLRLHGTDTTRLALSAPQNEALLLRLCHQRIFTITGSSRPDMLRGTAAADVICGRDGNAKIGDLSGNDWIYAGGATTAPEEELATTEYSAMPAATGCKALKATMRSMAARGTTAAAAVPAPTPPPPARPSWASHDSPRRPAHAAERTKPTAVGHHTAGSRPIGRLLPRRTGRPRSGA